MCFHCSTKAVLHLMCPWKNWDRHLETNWLGTKYFSQLIFMTGRGMKLSQGLQSQGLWRMECLSKDWAQGLGLLSPIFLRLYMWVYFYEIFYQYEHIACRIKLFTIRRSGWLQNVSSKWKIIKGTVPHSSGTRISRLTHNTQGPLMSSWKHFGWCYNCKAA